MSELLGFLLFLTVAYGALVNRQLFDRIKQVDTEAWERMGCPRSAFSWQAQAAIARLAQRRRGSWEDAKLGTLAARYRLTVSLLAIQLLLWGGWMIHARLQGSLP